MDDPPRLDGERPDDRERPFVGRARELAWLAGGFADAAAGTPRIAWVEGHSGIGKTQLVRRFLRKAPAHRLVAASGEESEASLSFGVLDQLWAALGGRGTSAHRAEGALDPLVAGAELLAAIGAGDDPTVLLVDDLQWIDSDSARALLFLLRRIQAEALLVVLLAHPGTDLRLGTGWSRLRRDVDRVATLHLEGLDVDELEDLLRESGRGREGRAGREDARRLHRHTAGHPMHATALLGEVGTAALRDPHAVLPLPRSLTAVVAAELDTLDAGVRRLLGAGAVLGPRFAPELAAMVAGVDDPFALLDRPATAQLVEHRSDGTVAFTHPLVHAAVYTELPAQDRRALHLAAVEVTSGTASLEHRVRGATGPDPELVHDLADAARGAEAAGHHARAADHLEAAARLAADAAEREELLLDALECVHVAGDFARAEAMRRAVEACAPGPRRTCALGLLAFAAGRLAEADDLLGATVADGAPSERWRSRAITTLALVRLQRGNWDGALDAAAAALAGGGTWDRSVAQFAAIFALAETGRGDEAGKLLDGASPGPSDRAPGALDVLAARGLARMLADDVTGALDDLSAVAARARGGEPIRLHELALANLGDVQHRAGRWDDAAFSVELAATMAADAARGAATVRAHTAAAAIDAARGRIDDAEAHRRRAAATPGVDDSHLSQLLLAMAGASIAAARGDGAAMVAELAAPFGGPLDPGVAAAGPSFWRVLVVEALLLADMVDEAADALVHLEAFIPGAPVAPHHFDTARLRGLLAAARGDDEGALDAHAAGLELVDERLAGAPSRARLLAEHGRSLLRLARPREAVGSLREAREVLARLGAVPELERCDRDLARCGLPGGGGDARAPLALTDAEAKVARAVVSGLSNREVAEQLYVSTKTVEYHLRNIFTKLGISSRRELPDHLDGAPG